MMKSNSLFKSTAIAVALLCGHAVADAQKVKDKSAPVEPTVKVERNVQVESNVKVVVSPKLTVVVTPAPKVAPAIKATPHVAPRVSLSSFSEQTTAADPNVIVSLSLLSGAVTVHGSDRREVRVQTNDGKRVELRRKDGTSGNTPATRLQVLFYDSVDNDDPAEECGGATDVKMEVPRGATVILKTQGGDIDISDVAEARAYTSHGDVSLRRVAKGAEVNTNSGDMVIRDVGGHVRLNSISGSVEAVNVSALDAGDFLQAKTVSGDVTLESISPARVEARTISGEVNLTGALAPGGNYEFNTTSGDITLTLPESVSFKLNAQVFATGEISTGFPLKQAGKTPGSAPPAPGHLIGTYGSGDASINLNSYSGTLRLIKK